jgi:hypothetical protein
MLTSISIRSQINALYDQDEDTEINDIQDLHEVGINANGLFGNVFVTRGLRVLREQLFLRLLLTTRRASEYTLDFRESPRYVEAKLT